jgi:hypothetical protein
LHSFAFESRHVRLRRPAGRRLGLLFANNDRSLDYHMTLHCGIELAALCAASQIELPIEREHSEVVTMGSGWRTWSTISRFPKVIRAVHSYRSASFGDCAGLRRQIPNHPMREQPTRRVGIVNDQDKCFAPAGTPEICNGGLVGPSRELTERRHHL